jgi:hypothetical protein
MRICQASVLILALLTVAPVDAGQICIGCPLQKLEKLAFRMGTGTSILSSVPESPRPTQNRLSVLPGLRCGEMIALEWRDVDLG